MRGSGNWVADVVVPATMAHGTPRRGGEGVVFGGEEGAEEGAESGACYSYYS